MPIQLSNRGGQRHESITTIDNATLLVVLAQATELWRPLGLVAGVPSSRLLHLGTLAFLVVYIHSRRRDLKSILVGRLGRLWSSALLIAPSSILSLQLIRGTLPIEQLAFWVSYHLMFAMLFVSAAILRFRMGSSFGSRFFSAGILVVWLGFVVNFANPTFIQSLLRYTDGSQTGGIVFQRILGFAPNPNVAAISLCLFMVVLACEERFQSRPIAWQALFLSATVVGVALTGSRTALLLLLLVLAVYIRSVSLYHSSIGRKSLKPLLAVGFIMLGSMLVPAAVQLFVEEDSVLDESLGDRFSALEGLLGGQSGLSTDQSAQLRVAIVPQYLTEIRKSPLLGSGPEFAANEIADGRFANVSQVAWLEWSLAYGIPFAVLLLWASGQLWWKAVEYRHFDPLLRLQCSSLLLVILVASFSLVNLNLLRCVLVTLGAVLGATQLVRRNRPAHDVGTQPDDAARRPR